MKRFTLILLAVIAVTFSAMAQSEKPKMVLGFEDKFYIYDDDGENPKSLVGSMFRVALIYEDKMVFYTSEMVESLVLPFNRVETISEGVRIFLKDKEIRFVYSNKSGLCMLYKAGITVFGMQTDYVKTQELMKKYVI